MNNEWEELISPKDLDVRKSWVDKVKIGIAKLYRGTEEHPRIRPRDGQKTYIDSHGRLIVESIVGVSSGMDPIDNSIIRYSRSTWYTNKKNTNIKGNLWGNNKIDFSTNWNRRYSWIFWYGNKRKYW